MMFTWFTRAYLFFGGGSLSCLKRTFQLTGGAQGAGGWSRRTPGARGVVQHQR